MSIQQLITATIKRTDLPHLDVEVILAYALKKSRIFILTYPEQTLTSSEQKEFEKLINRRATGEPIAYILGRKEFYGLDFIVNKHTLVPRPETEQMVEQAVYVLRSMLRNTVVIDVGTGSGNIIISIAHELENNNSRVAKNLDSRLRGNGKIKYYATDISKGALKTAKTNAKNHNLDKKIKFLHGSLLTPLFENCKLIPRISLEQKIVNSRMIILANLPYLSKEIYASTPVDVKKFEPKSALYSPEHGLRHYRELLEQTKKIIAEFHPQTITLLLEISPEQKQLLTKLIKNIFPSAKTEFKKDLAGKWRLCKISMAASSRT